MSGGRRVGLGVIGLGRGFSLMLPSFVRDHRFQLVAAATPGAEGRAAFARDFGGATYAEAAALVEDPKVDAVYVASPHQFHCEHVCAAAAAGRHVLVDKPLAIRLDEGQRMLEAAERAGVHVVVGPSHSFDAPVMLARRLVASGELGALRMLHAMNYTDFLYRPRRVEELDTAAGGGVIFSQAVHQVDVARLLAGGDAVDVFAQTGNWDPKRPTEGAYSAILRFRDGAFASLTYNGYGHFDSDMFMDGFGELGFRKDPAALGRARRALAGLSAEEEAARKRARNYGVAKAADPAGALPDAHEHFGLVIASCDGGDLRLRADGVDVYGEQGLKHHALAPPLVPRQEVMDELYRAVVEDQPPTRSVRWGLATLEAALAMLESTRIGQPVALSRQQALAG